MKGMLTSFLGKIGETNHPDGKAKKILSLAFIELPTNKIVTICSKINLSAR